MPETPQEREARELVATLRRSGFEAYWAGGCVRDRLLGRTPKDIDIATDARPDQITALFPKTVAIGKAFGVIGVITNQALYEVATFREDAGYSDGRRPDAVHFTDAREDALRRDFTVNALFYDPLSGEVHDFVDGRADLDARLIRAVGRPADRFQEDHLRMLRAVRFAAVLDFELESATRQAIKELADRLRHISPERIRDELVRLFTETDQPGRALQLLQVTGLLAVILPEVAAMDGVEQPPEYHPEGDVFTHTRLMLDELHRPAAELAFAVLLHDVGKPPTARFGSGRDGQERIRFDGHDKVGAEMTEAILGRLRFPNAFIRTVTHCVRNHMRFMHVQEMRRAKLRAMLAAPTFDIELELHRLDCLSSHNDLGHYHFLRRYREQLQAEPALPPAWVRGEDLLALGVPKGPAIGHWLKEAYARQLDGDATGRQDLLNWLAARIRERITPQNKHPRPPSSPEATRND
jgi:poly(A) polymerase